jgi:hypothetical protein
MWNPAKSMQIGLDTTRNSRNDERMEVQFRMRRVVVSYLNVYMYIHTCVGNCEGEADEMQSDSSVSQELFHLNA